tara:strand:- start:3622 stop:4560 length:939 start_codon:yes stop_codon:yes gene_type:complete
VSLRVLAGGALSLLQDSGRRGSHHLGMTLGGALDGEAYHYCNRLLQNPPDSSVIEISLGGLQLQAEVDTWFCVTGASMPLTIDGTEHALWRVHQLKAGQSVALGYAQDGSRSYLGVAEGFDIPHYFGSASTVIREGTGGLNGKPLAKGDSLPCPEVAQRRRLSLPRQYRPRYQRQATLRVIPGYQQHLFSREQQRQFFAFPYRVSERSDRMGYRLEGNPVHCDVDGVLSEGICLGAIQVPPDGQPIVLLNDHQTIGGYPKIGSALITDAWRLAQLNAGHSVHFAPITPAGARRALRNTHRFALNHPLQELTT